MAKSIYFSVTNTANLHKQIMLAERERERESEMMNVKKQINKQANKQM